MTKTPETVPERATEPGPVPEPVPVARPSDREEAEAPWRPWLPALCQPGLTPPAAAP